MRNGILWLASALMVALMVGEAARAQPPGRRGGTRGRSGAGGTLEKALADMKLSEEKKETARTAARAYQDNVQRLTNLASADLMLKLKDVVSKEEFMKLLETTQPARGLSVRRPGRNLASADMVERLMSFDKNKDGKLSKDELPERMQDLIAKGDLNKDGVLDQDEVKKLAARLAPPAQGRGRGQGAPSGRLTPNDVERAVSRLQLSEEKKKSVQAAVKSCRESVSTLTKFARADLLLRVNDVLSPEELKKFTAIVEREPRSGGRPFRRGE